MKKILTTTMIFIAFLLTLVMVIVVLRLPESVLTLIAGGILISIILVAGACIWYVKLMAQMNVGIRKAERRIKEAEAYRAEHEAIQDGYGMLHLINHLTGHSQNLTLDARTYRNGHAEPSKPEEMETLRLILAARHASTSKLMLAPPSSPEPESQHLDLLTILTQPTQSYAIIGGQQVGKTYQARRIANYWLQAGNKPIVIGPKWDRGEWDGCTLFGGEYNFDRVSQGMRIVQRLAEDRHADKGRSHKEQPVQPVFFDDWTAIRAKLESEAEAFILDATTLYASVNIILYFIIHLDTANAWGVGRVGAALHQNFIKLRIKPGYDSNGLIDRRLNQGYLIMPGQSEKDKRPVTLFGGTGQTLSLPEPPIIIQPTNEEKHLLDLIQMGVTSQKQLSESVWGKGKYGKFYNDKIASILAKYGLEVELK